MTCRPAAARGSDAARGSRGTRSGTHAACLAFASRPADAASSGRRVASARAAGDPTFTIDLHAFGHPHAGGRTLSHRRRDDRARPRSRFEQHGPGLPHGGGRRRHVFERRDGRFVVTMDRRFADIVMQVHADQSPRIVAGTRSHRPRAMGQSRARRSRAARSLSRPGSPATIRAPAMTAPSSARRHADRPDRGGLGRAAGEADPPVRPRVELPQARGSGRHAGHVIAVVLSGFHIYTAGFGLLVEIKHRAFHLALVLGLVFLVFPRPRPAQDRARDRQGMGLGARRSPRSISTSRGTW